MDGLYLVSLSPTLWAGQATKVVKVPANIHNKGLVLPRRKGGNNTTSSPLQETGWLGIGVG